MAVRPSEQDADIDFSGADTPAKLVAVAAKFLQDRDFDCARRDAELLMAYMLDCNSTELWRYDQPLALAAREQYRDILQRRLTHEPVAHITGHQDFWSLSFKVNADTLVPRPDTETLVEVGLRSISHLDQPNILDLGTGSGCILISLLHERPTATGLGLDVSSSALRIARENADRLGASERAKFIESDMFSCLEDDMCFDLIVSNPPYIESEDIKTLMPDVADYEPISALDGGADGLSFYRHIASVAPGFLTGGGALAVEVGHQQASVVSALFEQAGLLEVRSHNDLAGVARVVSGKKG